MEQVKLNNKELIKRAKELVALIENNELANTLTDRLRITEKEIEEKAQYERELKEWVAYGFRKHEINLKRFIDSYNQHRNRKLQLRITTTPDYPYIEKMVVGLHMEGEGFIFREDFRVGIGIGEDTDKQRMFMKERACEDILQALFSRGAGTFISPKLVPVTDKASDPYFMQGIQVRRPTQSFNLVIGVDDLRHPIYPDHMRIKEEVYPEH